MSSESFGTGTDPFRVTPFGTGTDTFRVGTGTFGTGTDPCPVSLLEKALILFV